MILLLLRDGTTREVYDCEDVIHKPGYLICLNYQGEPLTTFAAQEIVGYSLDPKIAETMREGGGSEVREPDLRSVSLPKWWDDGIDPGKVGRSQMEQFGKMLGGDKGGHGALLQSLMGMVSGGGLQGLLEKFQSAGLGEKAQSWVSSDQQNQPLNEQEVRQALGDQEVERIAQESGMSREEAGSGLANLLPQTVDQLTPEGAVPEQGELQNRLGSLLDKFPGL